MFTKKKEVIPFREFMSLPAAQPKEIPLTTSIYSFLPSISIKSLFPVAADPSFCLFLIGSCMIVGIALSEYLFASGGFIEISEGVSSFLKVALPLVGYGLIFWLFSTI